MNDLHAAAREARNQQKKKAPLSLLWMLGALIVFAVSASLDAISAPPSFWFAAQPFMRGVIGALAALFVVLFAHLVRFLLTRRSAAATEEDAR